MRALFLVILLTGISLRNNIVNASNPDSLISAIQTASEDDRIKLLIELSDLYQVRSDSQAIPYAEQARDLALKTNDFWLILEATNTLAEAYSEQSMFAETVELLEPFEKELEQKADRREKGLVYYNLANAYNLQARYDLAEFYFLQSITTFSNAGALEELAESRAGVANNFRFQGDYERSAQYWYEALEYYESVRDSQNIALVVEGLGVVNYLQEDYKGALEKFTQNLQFFQKRDDTVNLGITYTLIGLAWFELEEFDQSIENSRISLDIREKLDDVRGQGESLNNLALAYMGKGEWEIANDYLERSLQKMEESNDVRQVAVILSNMGDVELNLGQTDKAIELYKKSVSMADSTGLLYTSVTVYKKLFQTYADLGDYEEAFKYQNDYLAVRDSLYSEEKARAVKELEVIYETSKKEQQIRDLKKDKEISRNRGIALGGGVALLLIILVLVVALFRLRISANNQEKQALLAKEALTETKLQNTRIELDYNKKMLASYMENILKKNRLIEELETRVKSFPGAGNQEDAENVERLNELLEMKILTEQDWNNFKDHFEQVYKGFFSQLLKKYPDLTEGDQRLFILLKLNLSSKEMSDILGVSPDSVKKARYRLRKKLDMNEGENLQEFVSEFGSDLA